MKTITAIFRILATLIIVILSGGTLIFFVYAIFHVHWLFGCVVGSFVFAILLFKLSDLIEKNG